MINQKMLALGSKRSVIRESFEYGNRRNAEIGADKVFDFSLGNPNLPSPEIVTSTLLELVQETDPCKLHAYTSAVGDFEARKAISDQLNAEYNAFTDPGLIYLTCGAASSLMISLTAILNDVEEVIVLAPYFPEYKVFVEASGGVLKVLEPTADYSLNISGLEKTINEKTRAIIVNTPNNPTGAVLTKDELCALSKLLKEKSEEYGEPIYLISDEPYRELVYDNLKLELPINYYDNTIVCYSFSKSLSLAGERIGYIIVSPNAENAKELYFAVCGAGRALGYVCAPSMFQKLIARVVGAKPDVASYDRNRTALYNALTRLGFEVIKPQGAFYLFVKAPNGNALDFCEEAKKLELLFVPSDEFGVSGYARIAYCVSYDTIYNSLTAFEKLSSKYFNEV